MSRSRFPNLFIIGAMKAGTSSLHEYLHQHPEIFMSRFKEPQYFAPHLTRWGQAWGEGNPFPEPGPGWYLKLFEAAGDVKYAGESSVSYAARPWVSSCERRIFAFNPDARIIYLMRDPVERAISHYWHFVADGREDLDALTALRRRSDYVARSSYATQIEPYLDTFGPEQVFGLTLEEMNTDPSGTFERLFRWLGVEPDVPIRADTRHNVGAPELRQTRRRLVFLDTALKHWRWRAVERHLPDVIPSTARRMLYRTVNRAQVDLQPAIQFLQPVLGHETERLSKLLGRTFPEWTTLQSQFGPSTK